MDKEKSTNTFSTIIIPAYNEEATISDVIEKSLKNPFVNEVIVIDDGSSDNTSHKSKLAGAKVIRNDKNQGKAAAMERGVFEAKNNIVCFVDADLIGLTPNRLTVLLKPVLEGKADMNISIRKRRSHVMNRLIRIFPLIGGERALTKELWNAVPPKYKKRFQIEIAINYFAKKNKFKTRSFYMPGIHQIKKEKKHGPLRGLIERIFMIIDIIEISFSLYIIDKTKSLFTTKKYSEALRKN